MGEHDYKIPLQPNTEKTNIKPSLKVENSTDLNQTKAEDLLNHASETSVADSSTLFRIPRDGFDVSILAVQEPGEGRQSMKLLSELSQEIKQLLLNRGLDQIPKGRLLYIEVLNDDPLFSTTLKKIATDFKLKVGLAISENNKAIFNAMPFCEIEGKKFRILTVPEKFSEINSQALEEEINKIFIPRFIKGNQKIKKEALSSFLFSKRPSLLRLWREFE